MRIQRYLRLPLSCLRDIVGKKSLGACGGRNSKTITIDPLGDCFLAGYSAPDDYGWGDLHNSLRDAIHACGRHAGLAAAAEKGRRVREDGTESNCRPGDVKIPGAHGFEPAHGRVILADIVVTNVVCATHRDNGAITRGAAAVAATQAKHRKVSREQSVSKDDYFLPLAFESEGYSVHAVQTLLFGFAKHRVFHDGLAEDSYLTHRTHGNYMDAIANAHARGLARCLLERGMSNYSAHAGYNRTFLSSDTSDSSDSARTKRRRVGDHGGANGRVQLA